MKTEPNDYINPQEERTSQYSNVPDTFMSGGLTKREYFAAKAMQGLLAFADPGGTSHLNALVSESVEYADRLIEELNKEKKDE